MTSPQSVQEKFNLLRGRDEFTPRRFRFKASLYSRLARNPRLQKVRPRAVGPLIGQVDKSVEGSGYTSRSDHSKVDFDWRLPSTVRHDVPPIFAT